MERLHKEEGGNGKDKNINNENHIFDLTQNLKTCDKFCLSDLDKDNVKEKYRNLQRQRQPHFCSGTIFSTRGDDT